MQKIQAEWHEQWTLFKDEERFLFEEWIAPVTLEDFRGKSVLECGCGGGQHTSLVAAVASRITAVDLNTVDIARGRTAGFANVRFVVADIANMELEEQFDVVFCIGVIHHTDNPNKTFASIYKHCKPEGRVIVWTYSAEGNGLMRYIVEPIRKIIFAWLPRSVLVPVSKLLTLFLYPLVFTVYRSARMSFLPYYEYFKNFRRLSFERNVLNVFDKLNAPQTRFTTKEQCHEWFNANRFVPTSISIRSYAGVSYSLTAVKRPRGAPCENLI